LTAYASSSGEMSSFFSKYFSGKDGSPTRKLGRYAYAVDYLFLGIIFREIMLWYNMTS